MSKRRIECTLCVPNYVIKHNENIFDHWRTEHPEFWAEESKRQEAMK